MKDSDILVLKAFLAALCLQRFPLPPSVQTQLHKISNSLESRVAELDIIATSNSTLNVPYDQAYSLLVEDAAERGMGFVPPTNEPAPGENEMTSNITRDSPHSADEVTTDELRRILSVIDTKLDQASEVLAAANSVHAAKEQFARR